MTKKKLGSNKVREGKSSIPLKVKDKLELGQYPLNIEYEENRTYAESNAYGTLFYGWKSFVHCPNIYVVEGEDMYTTLRANIFSNEDIVYAGEGSFSIKEKTQEKVPVEDGCATHHLSDIQSWKNKNPYFSFLYDVHLPLNYCSARSNTAEIIYLPHTKRYAVVVKIITDPVIGYTGDTVRVIARIYKAQYGSLIDHKDVPDNGYARLLIDGAVAGTTSITDTGYVSFDYTVPEMGCGVYSVVVEYVSQDEYYDDSACEGTLFVPSHDVTLPTATCTQIWHTLGGTASIPVTFSDISLFDKVQVYIDSQLVPVEGSDENGYLIVQGTEVTLTFNIPKGYSSKCVWAYSGEHLMYLEYTDNVHHVTRKLFLPFLLIQYPTAIQLKSYGLDDTSTMIVGNNIEGTVINTFEPKRFVNHGFITIDIAPNIDFYNSANWGGNPVIDVTNQKITMTGANITYYEGASVKDLLSDTAISLTYFHNGWDGRKALGVYNPELSSWIGYCTPSPNGSEGHGVNEEKGYTHNISTDVTNAASWMRDGEESPLVIGYNEVEDNISLQYTSQDGTENVTVTIPLEGVDLGKYYLAFYDYRGRGMYVKNITLMEDM